VLGDSATSWQAGLDLETSVRSLVALRRRYTLKHTTFPLEKTSCGSSCQVRSSCYFFELSNAAHSAGWCFQAEL